METLSIVLSIVSIIVAVGATALAIVFYRWADLEAKKTSQNLGQVGSAIDRLDQVVAIIRTESFSLVKSSHADLLTLAMQGMRRVPEADDRPGESVAPSRLHSSVQAAAEDQGGVRAGSEEDIERDLLRVSDSLGMHMMKRQGADFASMLNKLQNQILTEFDKAPKGTVLYPGDIARRLGDKEYDIGEIVYALHTLQQSGQVMDAKGATEPRP